MTVASPFHHASCCDVVEYGNAVYVDSVDGHWLNRGTRAHPLKTLLDGVEKANSACPTDPLVAIQPGSYIGPITLSDRVIILTDSCDSVVIGK